MDAVADLSSSAAASTAPPSEAPTSEPTSPRKLAPSLLGRARSIRSSTPVNGGTQGMRLISLASRVARGLLAVASQVSAPYRLEQQTRSHHLSQSTLLSAASQSTTLPHQHHPRPVQSLVPSLLHLAAPRCSSTCGSCRQHRIVEQENSTRAWVPFRKPSRLMRRIPTCGLRCAAL